MHPAVDTYLYKLLYGCYRLQSAVTVVRNITFMRKPIVRELTTFELSAGERLLGCKLNGICATFYSKAIIDGQLYLSFIMSVYYYVCLIFQSAT